MTRRDVLQMVMAGVAAMTLDPERLLWVPGTKTFFLPSCSPAPPLLQWRMIASHPATGISMRFVREWEVDTFTIGDTITMAGIYH